MSAENPTPYIADDVQEELGDPEFAHRQHYSRATYALGCHGPLCKLAEKHRGRRRNQARAEAEGREYRAAHDIRKTDRDDELMPVVEWHLRDRREAASLVATP